MWLYWVIILNQFHMALLNRLWYWTILYNSTESVLILNQIWYCTSSVWLYWISYDNESVLYDSTEWVGLYSWISVQLCQSKAFDSNASAILELHTLSQAANRSEIAKSAGLGVSYQRPVLLSLFRSLKPSSIPVVTRALSLLLSVSITSKPSIGLSGQHSIL